MKRLFLTLLCLYSIEVHSLEYKILHENDSVSISQVKVMPYEEIGLHRDAYPQIVVALQGGVITRLEADGAYVKGLSGMTCVIPAICIAELLKASELENFRTEENLYKD